MSKQALEGKRLNAFGMDPNDLTVIGFDTKDGPEHPLYDPRVLEPLDEHMVLNIMEFGVLETVIVRKNGDTVEVVAGRRRVLHCREANKRLAKQGSEEHHVPCMLRKGDNGKVMGVYISENEIRKDDSLTAKAAKLERYLETGKTEEEASVAFGVSVQSIRNWRKISDLDSSVVKAVESGKIKASAAWNLASLSREEQKAELEKQLAAGGRVTAKRTQKAAKKSRTGEETFAPGKRVINKVLRLNEETEILTRDFIRGVCWVLGDVNPVTVKGLTELINQATAGKEEE